MINNDTLKRMTLLDLIDLNEAKQCKFNINGEEKIVVCLVRKKDKRYVMIAGGYLIEVTDEQFQNLKNALDKHLKKHVFGK